MVSKNMKNLKKDGNFYQIIAELNREKVIIEEKL
jgi:hypothetical protein